MRVKVRKSLTIKQMSVVAAVTLVTIALFMTLLLSHLIQQRKDDYINQLYNSSVQVRKPLADALLGSDLNAIKSTLITLRASGILGRAIVMTPENVQVISLDFATHRPIPGTAKMIFGIRLRLRFRFTPTAWHIPANPRRVILFFRWMITAYTASR